MFEVVIDMEKNAKDKSSKVVNKKDTPKSNKNEVNGVYKDIGLEHKIIPGNDCNDINCPYHGTLKIRGKVKQGVVISVKSNKTAVVEWTYLKKYPKYKRYMKTKSKVMAHNPLCVNAKTGDIVKIGECRPISKTKHFVIYDILNA